MAVPQPLPSREAVLEGFLSANGWGEAERMPLAGDASFRRYERLNRAGQSAVLMDAPPPHEKVGPFMGITHYLRERGLSAPNIMASDEVEGLLLLEDLGDDLFARLLKANPGQEALLYRSAVEVLIDVHKRGREAKEGLPEHNFDKMMQESGLLAEWFLPLVTNEQKARESYLSIWESLLRAHAPERSVFVHGDYHAENLIWLPSRTGLTRVGLLDYQDGRWGDPAFDLVSLFEDARRDVSPEVVKALLEFYVEASEQDADNFYQRYALLGAQRNCKIVGIFVRLCKRDNKPHYLSFLPRVWKHLEHDLSHPALGELKQWFDQYIASDWRGAIELERIQQKAS